MTRLLAPLLLGFSLLATASTVLAVDPSAYLSDMPGLATVETAFTGTDTLDTAALRLDAFLRLENIAKSMVGERGAAGKALQAEADLISSYAAAQDRILAAVKAGMPEDQRGFYAGTQFTAWAQVADRYQADPAFNSRFRSLFSAKFQSTYADTFSAQEKADAVPLELPFLTAPLTGTAALLATLKEQLPIFAWLAVYVVLFAVSGPRRAGARQDKGARP